MTIVYIEPKPKGKSEGDAITNYEIEVEGGKSIDGKIYTTQEAAIQEAKNKGYTYHVARVRNTNKGNRDHWRKG